MAKVEIFRERNGYSVYVEKLVQEFKDDKPVMVLKGKLDYFRSHGIESIRADAIRGQATNHSNLPPREAAYTFAIEATRELGVKINLDLIDDENPAEFFLDDRIRELAEKSAPSQASCEERALLLYGDRVLGPADTGDR